MPSNGADGGLRTLGRVYQPAINPVNMTTAGSLSEWLTAISFIRLNRVLQVLPDDYSTGFLEGQGGLAARLVHWAPEDHLPSLEGPCRCLACRVVEDLRRDG